MKVEAVNIKLILAAYDDIIICTKLTVFKRERFGNHPTLKTNEKTIQ